MNTKKKRVAVIGCGKFADAQYLPNIAKEANAECVAVVDIVEERAIAAAEKFGVPNHYSSVEELLEKCDFDIAMDCASIQAHHEVNMAILKAGKHLVSQKPVAPSVEMLNEQIAMAKKMNVKFVCVPIHPMRYDLSVSKQLMEDGTIGNPFYIKCHMTHGGPEYFSYRDVDPSWFYEEGAGALVDMGVHALQIVTTLFGPAKKILCMGKVTTPRRHVRSGAHDGKLIYSDKLPDQYAITLDFGEGRMALVDTGFSEKATKTPYIEIFGTEGTISISEYFMDNKLPDVYMDCPERGIRGWMKPMEWIAPPKKMISQCCCLADLIDAIDEDKEPVLSPEHARHVLEIMCKIPVAIEEERAITLETTF